METLKNNSESMKTVVETFLIEENVELIYDNEKLEKWNNLVTELGLTGQTKLAKPEKSPIPFMHMKRSVVEIFNILCPRKSSIREFNTTPIPIEILDLIALSEREQYFSKIEIWYDEKNPDPACIGVIEHWILHHKGSYNVIKDSPDFTTKGDAENYMIVNGINGEAYHYSWGDKEKSYLIGKWGDVRRPIEELKEMAIKRYTEEQGAQLRKAIIDTQRKLDDLGAEAFQMFN